MVSAMQSINRRVYGSVFLALFLGLAVVSVALAIDVAFLAADAAWNTSPTDPRLRLHLAYFPRCHNAGLGAFVATVPIQLARRPASKPLRSRLILVENVSEWERPFVVQPIPNNDFDHERRNLGHREYRQER